MRTITTPAAMKRLKVSKWTIHRWIRRGYLKAFQAGPQCHLQITSKSVERIMAKRAKGAVLILLALAAVGCGGRSVPHPVPVPNPPPCYQINGVGPCLEIVPKVVIQPTCYIDGIAKFPELKIYVDATGRQFCYDDTEAQADPAFLPIYWDFAAARVKSARPDAVIDPAWSSMVVFKFMPHDDYDVAGVPRWRAARVPGSESDPGYRRGVSTLGTWPIVVYALAEGFTSHRPWTQLEVTEHEALHVLWFLLFPNETCHGAEHLRAYNWVDHGSTCDPLNKSGVVQ